MANVPLTPESRLKENRTRLHLLESLPKCIVAAELGVFAGDFSRDILRICQPKKLYLVDLFRGTVESGDQDGRNMRMLDMSVQFNVLANQLAEEIASGQVEIVREWSWRWLERIPEGTLDFCYIDTSHRHDHTTYELAAALKAVKKGGYIGGHDYHWNFRGLQTAVEAFVKKHKLALDVWGGDALPSYRIQI
jgi:methyltransferase family protein